jgi:transposase
MNIPEQFYLDVLHCDFHGTGEFLINAWCKNFKDTTKTNKTKYYLKPEKRRIIDKLAVNVKFPSEIKRHQREITENLGDLKGNEFKNIIFYLAPIFKEVLKKNYFEHWASYVTALRLLCQSKISKEDLNDAFILMDYFVRRFATLYGKENMDYKVHVHIHYAMQVFLYGSLIFITCFIFEGNLKFSISYFPVF